MISKEVFDNLFKPVRKELEDGTVEYRLDGHLHSPDSDTPAVCAPSGHKMWCDFGLVSRYGGPAAVRPDGSWAWLLMGKLHREDGPATYESTTGTYEYYINGKRHREDGPAVIHESLGTEEFWLDGVQVTRDDIKMP